MKTNKLCKKHILKSKYLINYLFNNKNKKIHFEIFNVYYIVNQNIDSDSKLLISVGKKNIPKSNKRNLLKRRIKESYRMKLYDLNTLLQANDKHLLINIIYKIKYIKNYKEIDLEINKIFKRISFEIRNNNI